MKEMKESPSECSQCGASIPRGAVNCPGCGADERTGWDSNPWLPQTDVDIPDYLTEDYNPDRDPPIFDHQPSTRRVWVVVAVVVMVLIFMVLMRHDRIWLFRQD